MSPRWAVMWARSSTSSLPRFRRRSCKPIGKASSTRPSSSLRGVRRARGAIGWNLITWYYGIPSSSSHALVGGLVGAGIAKGGSATLVASGIVKTAVAIVRRRSSVLPWRSP